MAEPTCAITELPPSSCAHCRGLKSPEEEAAAIRRRLITTGRWFAAIYPGTCGVCGERFEVGTAIRLELSSNANHVSRWRAECCGGGAMSDGEWSPEAVRGVTMELPVLRPAPRVTGRVFPGEDREWRLLVLRLMRRRCGRC